MIKYRIDQTHVLFVIRFNTRKVKTIHCGCFIIDKVSSKVFRVDGCYRENYRNIVDTQEKIGIKYSLFRQYNDKI